MVLYDSQSLGQREPLDCPELLEKSQDVEPFESVRLRKRRRWGRIWSMEKGSPAVSLAGTVDALFSQFASLDGDVITENQMTENYAEHGKLWR